MKLHNKCDMQVRFLLVDTVRNQLAITLQGPIMYCRQTVLLDFQVRYQWMISLKRQASFITQKKHGNNMQPKIARLARMEGLEAHARAVESRGWTKGMNQS